jgi:pimeloyl-ACP methyl ester carboxylesterase
MITGKLIRQWSGLLLLAALLTHCHSQTPVPVSVEIGPTVTVSQTSEPRGEPQLGLGQTRLISDPYGQHYCYLPTTLTPGPDVLVLVHGTPAKQEVAAATAHYYLKNWIDFAEKHRIILIAPAFDHTNFSSKNGEQALGGYRGLFGRNMPADEFVLKIVDRVQTIHGNRGGKFYLYGHSAGGQFVARFIVTHPDRVKGAVITAAATYPQPTIDIAWPYGLGSLQTTLQWRDPGAETPVKVTPNIDTWLEAVTVPVTVIIGLNDLAAQPDRTGQKGNNRVVIAHNWVQDMRSFAIQHGVESRFQLSFIPNLGHSSIGLLPYSQKALLSSP